MVRILYANTPEGPKQRQIGGLRKDTARVHLRRRAGPFCRALVLAFSLLIPAIPPAFAQVQGTSPGTDAPAAQHPLPGDASFAHLVKHHPYWLSATLAFFVLLVFAAGRMAMLNRRIRESQAQLRRQVRQQEALLRISHAVQEIRESPDLERMIEALYGALREVGLNFQALAIHRLIDEDTRTFESYEVRPSGDIGRLVRPLPNVYRMWRAGKATYRPDLDAGAGGMPPGGVEKLRCRYGAPIRCILDVPHTSGTLALLSVQPDAFSETEVNFVRRVAGVLSVGVSRAEDVTERKRMEEILKESEETFRAITGSAQDAIIMMDNNGYISYWNKAAERIFGYARREIIGKDLHTLLVPERFYGAYQEGFVRFKVTGEGAAVGKTLELAGIKKGGEEFPVELSLASFKLKDKWHAVGIVRDIAERKRMEAEILGHEAQLRDLLESTHDMVQRVGVDGRFLYVNRTWRETLGYREEEVRKLTLFDIIHPDCRPHCTEMFRRLSQGEGIEEVEAVFVAKDGRPVQVEGHCSCVFRGGKPVATRGFFRDVTERRKMEEALRQVERDRVLMETAGAAAHEINQPLTVVSGLAQILLEAALDDDPHRRDFEAIYEGTKRIKGILDQMERARRHTTKSYVGDTRIVDFSKASAVEEGAQENE